MTNDLNTYVGISLSADAKSLVAIQTETIAGVYVAEGPGKEPRKLSGGPGRADGNSGLGWLPDGRTPFSAEVAGDVSVGATVPWLGWAAVILLVTAGLGTLLSVLLLVIALRERRVPGAR